MNIMEMGTRQIIWTDIEQKLNVWIDGIHFQSSFGPTSTKVDQVEIFIIFSEVLQDEEESGSWCLLHILIALS